MWLCKNNDKIVKIIIFAKIVNFACGSAKMTTKFNCKNRNFSQISVIIAINEILDTYAFLVVFQKTIFKYV